MHIMFRHFINKSTPETSFQGMALCLVNFGHVCLVKFVLRRPLYRHYWGYQQANNTSRILHRVARLRSQHIPLLPIRSSRLGHFMAGYSLNTLLGVGKRRGSLLDRSQGPHDTGKWSCFMITTRAYYCAITIHSGD